MKIGLEDDTHAELIGTFESFDEVLAELKRLAAIPWDQPPNRAPCSSWQTCERAYCIAGYDDGANPPFATESLFVLEVGAKGVRWQDRIRERWDEAVAKARNPRPQTASQPRVLYQPPPPTQP